MGIVCISFVPSQLQLVDMLTKKTSQSNIRKNFNYWKIGSYEGYAD